MHGARVDDLADLCRRCADGDEAAFSEVYERFGGTLYGTAWRILKRPQEAEEVVQEVFLTLYRAAGKDPLHNLGGWLHRVTVNRSLDRLRTRDRRAEVELGEELRAAGDAATTTALSVSAPPQPAADPPAAAGLGFGIDIERAIGRLPERTRMVFLLHDVEGFKHREIGELMGISDGSSKSQLFRARALLRRWLEPAEETP